MSKSPLMSMVKGVAVGMIAGACLGYAGKSAADDNPKIRKKYAASSAPWVMCRHGKIYVQIGT